MPKLLSACLAPLVVASLCLVSAPAEAQGKTRQPAHIKVKETVIKHRPPLPMAAVEVVRLRPQLSRTEPRPAQVHWLGRVMFGRLF